MIDTIILDLALVSFLSFTISWLVLPVSSPATAPAEHMVHATAAN